MAEEVRVLYWCDRHRQDGEDVEGTKQTITINGDAFEAEFCEGCISELVEPLRFALEECGRRVNRGRRSQAKAYAARAIAASESEGGLLSPTHDRDVMVTCPMPDCGKEVQVSSLGSHCRGQHGKSLFYVQEETGVHIVAARRPPVPKSTKKVAAARSRR